MIEKIRKPGRSKNIIVYIIFTLICLVFVFFGVTPGDVPTGRGGVAAIVSGTIIPMRKVNERLEQQEQALAKQLKGLSAGRRRLIRQNLRARITQEMINAAVAVKSARGFQASDLEIQDFITSITFFQEEGRFKPSLYQNYLSSRRISPTNFENDLRADLTVRGLQGAFYRGGQPSQYESDQVRAANQIKVRAKYVAFSMTDIAKKIKKGADGSQALENLMAAVKSGSATQRNAAIKKYGLKWKTTKPFALTSSYVSEFGGDDRIMDAVLSLKMGQTAPEILSSGPKYYILKLQSIIKGKAKKPVADFIERRGYALFGQWVEEARKTIRVIQKP